MHTPTHWLLFCETVSDFSVRVKLENEKTESTNENENKEDKNVDEFQECILQREPANSKLNTQKRHESLECHVINPFLTKLPS